jgi:hypothetical protein
MEAKVKRQEIRRTWARPLRFGVWERMRKPNPEAASVSLLTFCFLLLACCLWAGEEPGRVERTLDTTPNPRVSVSNLRGNVVVKGWDKSQVHTLFTTTSSKVGLDIEPTPPKGQADRVLLQTETPNAPVNATGETADYSLDVPLNSTLDIRNTQ